MADNVPITAGSGTSIAADDISSVFYQRVKLSLGADGTAADAGVGVGAASGALRVASSSDDTVLGALTETAPATDTASSGLNGRLQRIAQRITSLIALVPASLGQKAMSASMAVVVASDQSIIPVGGRSIRSAASLMTRPGDTTPYASGDLVANNTSAGSVTPLSFSAARANDTTGVIRRAKIRKSTTSTTNAQFRLHLYQNDPSATSGITNGDNGAWVTKEAGYLGAIDITVDRAFSDYSAGTGAPMVGSELTFAPTSGAQTVFGLLEARAAYTPGTSETFLVTLEVFQD